MFNEMMQSFNSGPIILPEQVKVCIKINVYNKWHPNEMEREVVKKAYALCYQLWRRGLDCVVHYRNEWGAIDLDTDVVIALGPCDDYVCKPYNYNIEWLIGCNEIPTRSFDCSVIQEECGFYIVESCEENSDQIKICDVQSTIDDVVDGVINYVAEERQGALIERRKRRKQYYSFKECQPLVSVVISTYNRKESLKRAVQSVLAQSYSNIEVVIVRDGGEPVKDVVASYNDSRIILIDNEDNGGKGYAVNCALQECNGEYVCYLDDDDVYYPWHIETLVGVLENIPGIEFVYSNTIKSEYVQRGDAKKSFCKKELVYRQQTSPRRMLQSNEITWLSVMHSRKVLDYVEGLDANLAALIDYDFWRRISSYFYLYHVDAVTAEYYLRNSKGDSGEGQITNLFTNDPVKYHWCDKVIKEKPLYPTSSALYKDEQREKQKAQAQYYVVKGDSYRATGEYEAAHACYIKAQSVLAESHEILFRLGSNMMSMEQYGKALEYFKRLVEIEGNIDVDLALVIAQCAVLAAEMAFSQSIIRKIDPAQLDESQRKVFLQLHKVALTQQQAVASEACPI